MSDRLLLVFFALVLIVLAKKYRFDLIQALRLLIEVIRMISLL